MGAAEHRQLGDDFPHGPNGAAAPPQPTLCRWLRGADDARRGASPAFYPSSPRAVHWRGHRHLLRGPFYWRILAQADPGYALYFDWMSKGPALTIPLFIVAVTFFIIAWHEAQTGAISPS